MPPATPVRKPLNRAAPSSVFERAAAARARCGVAPERAEARPTPTTLRHSSLCSVPRTALENSPKSHSSPRSSAAPIDVKGPFMRHAGFAG